MMANQQEEISSDVDFSVFTQKRLRVYRKKLAKINSLVEANQDLDADQKVRNH